MGALKRWIANDAGVAAPASHRSSHVVKILEDGGIPVPAGMVTQIEGALAAGAAGDIAQQSTCFMFVVVVYLGQLPGEDERMWFEVERSGEPWWSAVVFVGLWLFFTRTIMGRAVLATSNNRLAAQLVGINTNFIMTLSFALSAVLGDMP